MNRRKFFTFGLAAAPAAAATALGIRPEPEKEEPIEPIRSGEPIAQVGRKINALIERINRGGRG